MDFLDSAASGTRVLLGNEAFARGILETGVEYVSTYPGTPTTEIVDLLASNPDFAGQLRLEYSVNEATALEAGMGASWTGARTVVAFKHMGLNVAADPFHGLAYTGVRGGLVIICGADPGAQSSTNEQDNRFYAMHAQIPVLEPSTVQECKDLVRVAMRLSEERGLPVMIWASTRVCHGTGVVELTPFERPASPATRNFEHQPGQFINARATAVQHHVETHARLRALEGSPVWIKDVVEVVPGVGSTGIVTAGAAYPYVREAIHILSVQAPILRLGGTYPFPGEALAEFTRNQQLNHLIVVEELEPYLELHIRSTITQSTNPVKVTGKMFRKESEREAVLPVSGELDVDMVRDFLCNVLSGGESPGTKESGSLKENSGQLAELRAMAPQRDPSFCPGCAHRSVMYALQRVKTKLAKQGVDIVVGGDIGCYTMGIHPPFQLMDWVVSMGAGIGIANGVARFADPTIQRVVALIGDSTFYHAGLQRLLNAAWHGLDLLVILLENYWTAMTGHQPTPGSREALKTAEVVKAFGVTQVTTVGGYNLERLERTLEKYIELRGVRVMVVEEECALVRGRRVRQLHNRLDRAGVQYPRLKYEIYDQCVQCDECFIRLGCPAIVIKEDAEGNAHYRIDQVRCEADFCGACIQLCPVSAIKLTEFHPHICLDDACAELEAGEAPNENKEGGDHP